eukprot:152960_1
MSNDKKRQRECNTGEYGTDYFESLEPTQKRQKLSNSSSSSDYLLSLPESEGSLFNDELFCDDTSSSGSSSDESSIKFDDDDGDDDDDDIDIDIITPKATT